MSATLWRRLLVALGDLVVMFVLIGMGWLGGFELALVVVVEAVVLAAGTAVLMRRTARTMRDRYGWLSTVALAPYVRPPNGITKGKPDGRWLFGDRAADSTAQTAQLLAAVVFVPPLLMVGLSGAARDQATFTGVLLMLAVAGRSVLHPLAILRGHRDGLEQDGYVTIGSSANRLVFGIVGYFAGLLIAGIAAMNGGDGWLVAMFLAFYPVINFRYRAAAKSVDTTLSPLPVHLLSGRFEVPDQ